MNDSNPKPETTRQVYVDRMGRRITDPAAIESRRLRSILRRLNAITGKLGRKYPETVTAGEIARSAQTTASAVISWAMDAYLVEIIETDGPRSSWWVYEDGE